MRISDWSSDVFSSDLRTERTAGRGCSPRPVFHGQLHLLAVRNLQHIAVRVGDIGPIAHRRAPVFGAFQQDTRLRRARGQPVAVFAACAGHPQMADRPERTILRSEEHTSELQSTMRTSYAAFCL